MRTNVLIGLVALAGLAGAAPRAAAQEATAAVRTWSGQSWRLIQPSLEVFYTIVPNSREGAARVGDIESIGATGELERRVAREAGAPEPKQGHRQREVVTFFREGIETRIPLASIRSLQFFRQPVEKSPLPPYLAAIHFRYSATAVLVDGSRVEGDYVNLGTTVLRGMTPQGRVDIPWQEIENIRFEVADGPTTTTEEVTVTLQPTVAEARVPELQRPVSVKREIAPLKDVFFEFDSFVLGDDAKVALNEKVTWLKANPDGKIVVEGHTDERGTNEYNLALGARRVQAVRDYLVAAGIDGGRISTISYGEERPFVIGNDESAWKWNRRVHLVLTK